MANNLAALFAKKATPDGQPNAAHNGTDASDSGGTQSVSPVESAATVVPPANQSAEAQPAKPANPFASKANPFAKGAGVGVSVGDPQPSGNPVGGGLTGPGVAAALVSSESQSGHDDTGSLASGPIASLDDLSNSTDLGVDKRKRMSGFSDETPATAPTRELDGLTKEELGFVDLLDGLYHVIHEPDLMGQVVRNIMVELGTHEEYKRMIAPLDIRTMVRGMRESMGLAIVKKQETKTRKSAGAKASKNVDADMLADLESLGISLD